MTTPVRNHVLLTGGSGFIGSACLRAEDRNARPVVATSTKKRQDTDACSSARWVQWDATTQALPPVDLATCQTVVHMATPRNLTPETAADRTQLYTVTVDATRSLLEEAVANNVQRFIFISTGDVMSGDTKPVQETPGPYVPRGYYGAVNAAAEQIALAYGDDISVSIVRPYHPYGPGGERYIVNKLVHWIFEGRTIPLEGSEGIYINPIWIDDLASGIWRVIDSDETGIFHFSGPEIVSFRALCQMIADKLGKPVSFSNAGREPVQRHWGSSERAQTMLGAFCKVPLDLGIGQLCTAYHE